MSEPKRFDPIQFFEMGGSGYGEMKECSDGDYVRHDDVVDLINQNCKQALHLAGAIDLLTRARNAMPVDAEIYERVQRFLTVEVKAVR